MEASGGSHHMVNVVLLSDPGPEEDPPKVDVVGHVATGEIAYRDSEVALQDFDGHNAFF